MDVLREKLIVYSGYELLVCPRAHTHIHLGVGVLDDQYVLGVLNARFVLGVGNFNHSGLDDTNARKVARGVCSRFDLIGTLDRG